MNLNDVQKKLAEKLEVSQTEARKIYDAVVEMITEEVRDSADQDITVPGIVVFSKTAKEARTAKNPATVADKDQSCFNVLNRDAIGQSLHALNFNDPAI